MMYIVCYKDQFHIYFKCYFDIVVEITIIMFNISEEENILFYKNFISAYLS